MELEYTVEYYEAINGKQYARDFLDKLEKKSGELWIVTIGLIKNLKFGKYHTLPYSRALGGGLFEIRPRLGKAICRLNYCFVGRQRIFLLNGFNDKKDQEREIKKARKLLKECKEGIKND